MQHSLQSWLGASVLLCAAVMTFFAPPIVFPAIPYATRSNSGTASTSTQQIQSQQVGDLSITVQVLPGRANATNTVVATISEESSGRLITDAQVQFSTNMEVMNMGTAQVTLPAGHPTYVATFEKKTAFSMPGVWDLTLTVRRAQHPPVQAQFQITPTG